MKEYIQVRVKALPRSSTKGLRCKLTFNGASKVIPWDYGFTWARTIAWSWLEAKGALCFGCTEDSILCEFTQWEKLKEIFA